MFEQWLTGQVVEQDNPFYHRVIEGSGPSWTNPNQLTFDYSTEDGLLLRGDSGSVEFVIKAGWRLRFELRSGKWMAFTSGIASEDILEKNYNWGAYNTGFGGDSIASFTMRSGSAMAITDGPVSSEYAGLHQEAELTSTGRISEESILLKLTTDNEGLENDYFGEIRSLTWDQGLKGHPLTLTLVAWERVGQAVDDEIISEDSEQMEQPSEQPKIIEEGAGFIVRVGLEGEAWIVYLNGQQKGAFETEADAITAALELAQIEREKGYLDPNATLKDGTVNAVQAIFGGFMLGFPFAVGVILIGASIHWMVGKVFGND